MPMNMEFKRTLPAPQTVKDMYPVTEEMAQNKRENDRQIQAVITGGDPRLMLLIGPCSADREDAVLEYAARLRTLQEQVKDKLLLVPRIYSNKPRTTGDGYKGMLHQPDPNGQPDMLKGLIAIRKMHMKVLEQTGFSSADELLYPENYYYLSDILSYAAIGARSVEDQQHRLIASGLDVPVGMKNPTSGDLSVMMNSILAAQHAHTFLFSQWEVHSKGNPLAHAILRGSVNKYGRSLPNYHYEDLHRMDRRSADKGGCVPIYTCRCTTLVLRYFGVEAGAEDAGEKHPARLRWTAGPLLSAPSAERLNSTDRKPLLFAHFPSGARPQRRV